MRFLFLILLFPITLFSQEKINIENIEPKKEYENVYSETLYENEFSSYYLIWIKKDVKMHKHAAHTESITVVDGYGTMTVGEEIFEIQKGDYFIIPKNTYHSLEVKSEVPIKVISIQTPKFNPKDRIFKEK